MNIEFPMTLPSMANARMHWAQRARIVKNQRMLVTYSLKNRRVPPAMPWDQDIVVTITRKAPRMLDDDNLVSACKAVRDAIAKHFDIDDRNPRIKWRCAQAQAAKPSVLVQFEPIAGMRRLDDEELEVRHGR